jgi:hypothetical protein
VTGTAASPAPGPSAAEPPRPCSLLVVSLALTAVSLALPAAFGPLGPVAAGVLAFLGYRRVRASGGRLRGPVLAKVAMTAALVLLAAEAWIFVKHASSAAAEVRIQAATGRVESLLRTGTAEGGWEILAPDARGALDRAAFTESLRDAMGRLGPLESLGPPREAGGDWERTGTFDEGEEAELRLRYAFDATFRKGPGRIELEVRVRRRGAAVTADLTSLRVDPGKR